MISLFQRSLKFRFTTPYPSNASLKSSDTTFYASQLTKNIQMNRLSLPNQHFTKVPFGKYNSEHMITIDYDRNSGWTSPLLAPFQNISLHPFSSSLNYAVQCYEGLKGYKNDKGEIRIFRPKCNALRFKRTSLRLSLPDFDGEQLIKLIGQFVRTEERWIPPITQCSYYIRPFHISSNQVLGQTQPDQSKLLIIGGPVGPYYTSGFKPISLYCAVQSIRSAPKGTGSFKIGGNYAPTIQIAQQVIAKGHQQALWLYQNKVIQVGSSNIFFIFKDTATGIIQIATPQLQDLILPGITRDSILQLLRDEKEYKVSQRQIFIEEIVQRQKRGELLQCFGAGTAVIISAVNNIQYNGVNYNISVDPVKQIGLISLKIRQKLLDIQEGRAADKYGWIYRVK